MPEILEVAAVLVGWFLFVLFVLPYLVVFLAALWPAKDAGPPPPSGHGKVTSDEPW